MTQVLWRDMAKWGEKALSYFLIQKKLLISVLEEQVADGNTLCSRNSRVLDFAFLVAVW